jgi:Holliday junction resolvase RusA-like endonuclease
MITIYIPGAPVTATAQQKGVHVVKGRPVFYTKSEVTQAHEAIARHVKSPAVPLSGPLAVSITFVFPLRLIDVSSNELIPMFARPDIDNLVKLILDVLTHKRCWVDDGQVCSLYVSKLRGLEPGTSITIENFGETETA